MTIEELKRKIEEVKRSNVQVETELRLLDQEKQKIFEELKKEGFDPNNLDSVIEKMEKDIENELGLIKIPSLL